jgi:hypothetical protein
VKKAVVVSLAMVLLLLGGGSLIPSYAQTPAEDDTPTFYRLVPGTYVNGWPRFSVRYPKDWVEMRPTVGEVFRVGRVVGTGPQPPFNECRINVYPVPAAWSTGTAADEWVWGMKGVGASDVTVVSDKPSQLRDGTPAREVMLHMVMNGEPTDVMGLMMEKGGMLVRIMVDWDPRYGTGEHLKAVLSSLQFEPEKDKPVRVPSDVRAFLDQWGNDIVAHDVAKVMGHYSDGFLNSGNKKRFVEESFRRGIGTITSWEVTITDFVAAGDRAYLAGFWTVNRTMSLPLRDTSIIKENGQWKWYGNQRDPAPDPSPPQR